MNKEEIVDKLFEGYSDYPSSDKVFEAMDIWAKHQSIAFAEFVKDNHYTRNLNSDDTRWYRYFQKREDFPAGFSMMSGVSEYFTSEQLYELFLLHQQSLT